MKRILLPLLLCVSIPAMGAYYGGPYVWTEDAQTGGYYAPPVGAVGSLDLRGGNLAGNAVFVADALPPPYILLGASLETTLGDKARTQWGNLFGVTPPAGTLADALWWVVTVGAKEGVGIRPGRDGMLRLTLAGETIREEKFAGELDAYWPKLQDRLQDDYRKVREASLSEGSKDETLYLRYLADLEAKYAIESDKFIPPDLPKEEPVKPETVYTDDFNRDDAADLGGDWTEIASNVGIVSNRAVTSDAAVLIARLDKDLSSDDMYTEAATWMSSNSNQMSINARHISTTDHTYYNFRRQTQWRIYRVSSGSSTLLDNSVSLPAHSAGNVMRIEVEGSDIRCYVDGGLIYDLTDGSPVTGHVRGGIRANNQSGHTTEWDDFEVGDLGEEPDPPVSFQHPVNLFESHIFGRVVR